MKKIYLIMFTFLTGLAFSQELTIGSNIDDYLRDNIKLYDHNQIIGDANGWNDILIRVSSDSNNEAATMMSYQQLGETGGVFAFLLGTPPDAYCLVDTDGDRILDKKNLNVILPYWAMKPSTISTDDPDIKQLMDYFYNSFQDNGGPNGPNSEIPKGIQLVKKAVIDPSIPNRDIYYLFHYYLSYNQMYPDVCLNSILFLKDVFQERFGYIHVVLDLYHFETLLNLGKNEEARNLLSGIISNNQEFIPLKAYSFNMEKNPELQNKKKDDLLKNHSEHWMVKNMLGL